MPAGRTLVPPFPVSNNQTILTAKIMKIIHRLGQLLVLVLSLAATSAQATFFSYEYTFGDGLVVSGSLDGTQKGNFVENVSNVSVFFNGTAMLGTIFTANYDGTGYLNSPVVSFDALQNNFLFANSDLAAGDFGYDSVFYMFNASVFADTAVAFSTMGFASQDWPTADGKWSLTVPEGGSTVLLLCGAGVGLAFVRRRFSPPQGGRRLFAELAQ